MEKAGTSLSAWKSASNLDMSNIKNDQFKTKYRSVRIQNIWQNDFLSVDFDKKENLSASESKEFSSVSKDAKTDFNYIGSQNMLEAEKEIIQRKKRKSKIKKKRKLAIDLEIDDISDKNEKQKQTCEEAETVQHCGIEIEPREFLQNEFCLKFSPDVSQCNECLQLQSIEKKNIQHPYCSFINYRKLFISADGKISNSGFLESSDSSTEDRQIWLPQTDMPSKLLTVEDSEKILFYLKNLLCMIIEQEEKIVDLYGKSIQKMTWKKFIQNTDESCNVCDTLIFNMHWICPKCAFCICINCYQSVKAEIEGKAYESEKLFTKNYRTLWCHDYQLHELETLLLTQVIPGNILRLVHHALETVCKLRKISGLKFENLCNYDPNYTSIHAVTKLTKNSFTNKYIVNDETLKFNNNSILEFIEMESVDNFSYFKDFSGNNQGKHGDTYIAVSFLSTVGIEPAYNFEANDAIQIHETFSNRLLNDCLENSKSEIENEELDVVSTFDTRYAEYGIYENALLPGMFTAECLQLGNGMSHTWLNNGKLLLLLKEDMTLFQEQWKRQQPIIIAGVLKNIPVDFWHPRHYNEVIGKGKSAVISYKTGKIMHRVTSAKYWEGFVFTRKQVKDASESSTSLKLKEWPSRGSFDIMLPQHFENIMNALPVPEYTSPDGVFNLTSRLPACFNQPDFSPKIESAYSSVFDVNCMTTNLRLNISDTMNILVHADLPKAEETGTYLDAILEAMDESDCGRRTRAGPLFHEASPGALWHIYNISDADKIRKFLFQIADERKVKLKDGDDLLQNDCWCLDKTLRERLSAEYGVKDCTIIQCVGDAIFIPSGTPYQVRNLRNCVNVTTKFISPETILTSFKLVQRSRSLRHLYPNLKKDIPIQHIIYHSVKDSLSRFLHGAVTGELKEF